jgi:osmoprotectant transport system permease protein
VKRYYSLFVFLALAGFLSHGPLFGASKVTIGSKAFTESVILGEILVHLAAGSGVHPIYKPSLGGTGLVWNALIKGEMDVYPEYSGTIKEVIMAGKGVPGDPAMRSFLARHGIRMTAPLGFNNNYVLGMKKEVAGKYGIDRISQLSAHPELVFGFSHEFMDRADGWPGLRSLYGLTPKRVFGLDHDLAYRGLDDGSIDVIDLYSTDPEIGYYGIQTLSDDRHYFPVYTAVFLFRADLEDRAPAFVAALKRLEGQISNDDMMKMNERAKIKKIAEAKVASEFLAERFPLAERAAPQTGATRENVMRSIWQRTGEHLRLVSISLLAAILIAIPLGIVSEKKEPLGQIILGCVGIIQTIPSLALLVFMLPLLGIGGPPAIAALFLYSLLPIVRNTYTGMRDIPPSVRESAEALGLPPWARLRLVELPMASRAIIAGIKTSAIINVGTATLGALIGAGGYGQPILTGIRLDDLGLILQGAVPAACLAFLVQGIFEVVELVFVPKGLRLKSSK